MEFHEKLQELRKNRELTQEELAEAIFVSRAAVSKWESGRGYPNIDSLKELSAFFEVTIDDLLSSETLLSIADKENKSNIQSICDQLFGIIDVCSIMLIVLPLYPNTVNGFIYSVNLFEYTQTTSMIRMMYWAMFLTLIIVGAVKLLVANTVNIRLNKVMTKVSILISSMLVLILSMTREAYAIIVVFLLLMVKVVFLLKYTKP
jgi:transcriptional regulator with XRE-family HTH domain